jgi:hypothetical protein
VRLLLPARLVLAAAAATAVLLANKLTGSGTSVLVSAWLLLARHVYDVLCSYHQVGMDSQPVMHRMPGFFACGRVLDQLCGAAALLRKGLCTMRSTPSWQRHAGMLDGVAPVAHDNVEHVMWQSCSV